MPKHSLSIMKIFFLYSDRKIILNHAGADRLFCCLAKLHKFLLESNFSEFLKLTTSTCSVVSLTDFEDGQCSCYQEQAHVA